MDLFVMIANEEELFAKLYGRGTNGVEVTTLRMDNALGEMSHWPEYTCRLLSGSREEDYARFKALIVAERMRVSRLFAGK